MTHPVPPRTVPLLACVGPEERALAARAAGRLGAALGADGEAWRVPLRFADPGPPAAAVPGVVYLSLRPLLADPGPALDARAAAWEARLPALGRAVLLGNVPRGRAPGADPEASARARRVGALALRWSAAHDVAVVDLDRALSSSGAVEGWLDTDDGVTRGAWALADALLAADLDALVPPALAERARAALGRPP